MGRRSNWCFPGDTLDHIPLPNADQAVIDPSKVRDYLLSIAADAANAAPAERLTVGQIDPTASLNRRRLQVHDDWPDWWHWQLELSPHLLKRMIDRQFTETDLRSMLEDARSYARDAEPERWLIDTEFHGRSWQVVVEPDDALNLLVVVTAYPIE